MTMLFILLGCGFALGAMFGKKVRRVVRKTMHAEQDALDAAEKAAFAKGRKQGNADAIAVLCDTEDNAAIVAMTDTDSIVPMFERYYPYSMAMYPELKLIGWEVKDADLLRATMRATGKTPREAYADWKAKRAVARAICEQLDTLGKTP